MTEIWTRLWWFMNSSKPLLQPTWSYLLDHHSSLLHSHLFSALFPAVAYFIICTWFSCLMVIGPSHWRVPRPQILGIAHRSLTERDCVVHTLLLTLFLVIPASVLQSVLRAQIELPSRAPTILEIVTGLMASLLLFDAQYFVWHGLHHACPGLYRSVHAKHHQVLQPFSWSTQFMSPYELFATGLWTAMDPIVLGLHPLTGLLFSILNVYLSVEDHSGLELPISLAHLLPWGLYGGSAYHDKHHRRHKWNLAPYFTHWDQLAGTLGP